MFCMNIEINICNHKKILSPGFVQSNSHHESAEFLRVNSLKFPLPIYTVYYRQCAAHRFH
jgi:hypothetical protein